MQWGMGWIHREWSCQQAQYLVHTYIINGASWNKTVDFRFLFWSLGSWHCLKDVLRRLVPFYKKTFSVTLSLVECIHNAFLLNHFSPKHHCWLMLKHCSGTETQFCDHILSVNTMHLSNERREATLFCFLFEHAALFSWHNFDKIANSKHCSGTIGFCWCSNGIKFVTDNSNYIRNFLSNWPCCLHQHK